MFFAQWWVLDLTSEPLDLFTPFAIFRKRTRRRRARAGEREETFGSYFEKLLTISTVLIAFSVGSRPLRLAYAV